MARVIFIASVLAAAALWFSQASPALSQEPPPSVSLVMFPPMAFVGDSITVTAIPQGFAATSTAFEWYRDGALLPYSSGVGRTTLALSTDPDKPETIAIRVVARPPGLGPIEGRATIQTLPGGPTQNLQIISGLTTSFTVKASNSNPDPGESVTVSVSTFAFDTTAASYQWYINGVRQSEASGRGKTQLTLTAGKEGETKTVSVDVTTPDGQNKSGSVTIRPATATLYWWTDTSVPYWYKGKALPSVGARVSVLALPNVSNPSALSYQWEFNAGFLQQASGVGKSSYSFTISLPVEEQVGITMKHPAGTFEKTRSIGIRPATPLVGIYEVRPLRGVVFEKKLNEFRAPSGEPYDFVALPFFFPKERQNNLNYLWTLNGKDILGAFAKPWLFTLTSNPNTPSLDSLSVVIKDPAAPSSPAHAALTVQLH